MITRKELSITKAQTRRNRPTSNSADDVWTSSQQWLSSPASKDFDTLAQPQPYLATNIKRVNRDPGSLTACDVLQLQRTIGNQSLQRLLARAVVVSTPVSAGAMIQRRGTYNPINIMQAGNVGAIEEQEYGSGPAVALTRITSCVGFLARSGNQVYGLHLGVLDANGIDVATINIPNLGAAIAAIWPANPEAVFQVGMSNNWNGDVLQAIYPHVMNAPELASDTNNAGKIYSARVNGGKLEVLRDGNRVWIEP